MCKKLYNNEQSREDFTNIEPNGIFCGPSLEGNIQFDPSRTQELIPAELADPKCQFCKHIITEVNEIFDQDGASCQHSREFCMGHLLEAVHTSLIWRMSKQ